MEKRISYQQFQSVKSVAKAIDPIVRKKETLERNLLKLKEEYMGCKAQIDALEAGIVNIIGFHVTDLVKKVIEPGVDGKGNAIKTTKYLPTSIVSYDEQKKQYVIHIPDAEGTNVAEPIVPPTTADGPGSDFDVDAMNEESEIF